MNVVWINPGDISSYENRPFSNRACIRLRCIEPALYLCGKGCNVRSLNIFNCQQWVNEPEFYQSDVYVVGKAFVNISPILQRLRQLGKSIVIDVCDNIYEPPEDGLKGIYEEILPFASRVIANTQTLADILVERLGADVVVIPDHVEGEKLYPSFKRKEDSLNLLWFGYPNNLPLLNDCLPQLETLADTRRVKISVVTSWNTELLKKFENAGDGVNIEPVNWSPDAMRTELSACDVVIIPSSMTPARITKTANRVMTSLYAGKHVVAFPLPAYEEFSRYISLEEDMAKGISESLNSPAIIRQRIADGQKYIDEHYSPGLVSRSWYSALLGV